MAIVTYLQALLPDADDVEEASQEVMAQFIDRGLDMASPQKGRFRDYLKVAVRNAAITHQRRERRGNAQRQPIETLPDPISPDQDQLWLGSWRECLLGKAWRVLEDYQQGRTHNQYHAIMKLSVDFPGETSEGLADRLAQSTGVRIAPTAYRQQLSRARKMFAGALIQIVRDSLPESAKSRDELIAELQELGLWVYVHRYFPK